MKTLFLFPVYLVLQVITYALALFAMVFCWLIALFVDESTGNLPKYLRWFQAADATCYDVQWVAEHPTWSKYKIAYTWIARNAAWGFRRWAGPDMSGDHIVTSKGNLNIADGEFGVAGWFFIVSNKGFWNFSYVLDLGNGSCMRGEAGWYLVPLAKGYESVNTGMFQSDPIRFYDFGRKGN